MNTTPKIASLTDYINHCIRDYSGDYEYLKESVYSLHLPDVHPAVWEMAEIQRHFLALNLSLRNLEKYINE